MKITARYDAGYGNPRLALELWDDKGYFTSSYEVPMNQGTALAVIAELDRLNVVDRAVKRGFPSPTGLGNP
jgi:hypothetical protein